MSSWTDKRPMSPHLQVWKPHLTMATSILHRIAGCGNYIGIFIVIGWLFVTTLGPERYDQFSAVIGSLPGLVILFGFTVSICFHLLSGLRHLVWDAGKGFNPKSASFFSALILLASIVLAVAIFVLGGLVPGFDPLNFQAGAA